MSEPVDRAIARAPRMTIRRFASAADADREDHAYWQQIPESERALGSERPFGELEVDFIGRASFIRNKRATGRLRDLSDIDGMD